MVGFFHTRAFIAAEAWRRQFSVEEDTQKLRSFLPKIYELIDEAELFLHDLYVVVLIKQLRDTAYDAEDLLNGVTDEQGGAIQPTNRLSNWASNFVKGMTNSGSSRANFIHRTLSRLAGELDVATKCPIFAEAPNTNFELVRSDTVPFFPKSGAVSRDEELNEVVSVLLLLSSRGKEASVDHGPCSKKRKTECFSVLPIVSQEGMGKTTLAQLAYNDPRVQDRFQLKMWINISHYISEKNSAIEKVIREIKETAIKEEIQSDIPDLVSSQVENEGMVESRRFLIVLDDVWGVDDMTWERLCKPLRHARKGSIILVTTPSLGVAESMMDSVDPFSLKPLTYCISWDLIKKSIPGLENVSHYMHLEEIGKGIVENLEGSPLAVKILGALLSIDLSSEHWTTIKILLSPLSILELSYLYMPAHLKRCVSICSMFPKGYSIDKDFLVNIWVAEGFIPQINTLMEEIGTMYFEELVCRSLLHQSQMDPSTCVIHGLMHTLIQNLSKAECYRIEDVENENGDEKKIPETTRHLSVCTNHLDQTLLNDWNYRYKLRSLLILCKVVNLSSIIDYLLDEFKNLRLLVFKYCEIKKLPESIGNLRQLRYLDISNTCVETLPASLCCLHNLQVINMLHCPVKIIPKGFTKLTNLRKLYMQQELFSQIPEIGKLTSLQTLPTFTVQKKPGFGIEELRDMTQLSDCLWLKILENVHTKKAALEAKLDNKMYLDKLILQWSRSRHANFRHGNFTLDEEVLESLKPHQNLKLLQVGYYCGAKFPNWLGTETLPCLSKLWLKDCYNLRQLPSIPQSLTVLRLDNVGLESLPISFDPDFHFIDSHLSELHIERCSNLTSLESWPSSFFLPALRSIYIGYCEELVLLPVQGLQRFCSLEVFELVACPNIHFQSELVFPSSIKRLVLDSCGDLDKSLPKGLENLTSLVTLMISSCQNLETLPAQVLHKLEKLEYLKIDNCKKLSSLEGLDRLADLEELSVSKCENLTKLSPLVSNSAGGSNTVSRLESLCVDHSALLELPGLRSVFSSLKKLEIRDSPEERIFRGQRWFQSLERLEEMCLCNCPKLRWLPEDLNRLKGLKSMRIYGCPEIQSVPKSGLPMSLKSLDFSNCHKMLSQQLEKIKRLMEYCE
ncbi:hypothetical protein LUZ60_009675 [Juncus effusus]|nr:hypothetical protein LUZ60_009675 [Juncus effusus]